MITKIPFGQTGHLSSRILFGAAVAFVLNRPGVFLNSASDPVLLERTLDAASRFSAGEGIGDFMETLAGMELNPLFVDSDAI